MYIFFDSFRVFTQYYWQTFLHRTMLWCFTNVLNIFFAINCCIFWPAFFVLKSRENTKKLQICCKIQQKSLHQNTGRRFYFPKNEFYSKFVTILELFSIKNIEKLFWSALGVRSTQTLVKIYYNKLILKSLNFNFLIA